MPDLNGGASVRKEIDLKSGVTRLLAEEQYARQVQLKFSQHLQKHANLDALARCKALNSFLAANVCTPNLLSYDHLFSNHFF
jgi:hypothetical protein